MNLKSRLTVILLAVSFALTARAESPASVPAMGAEPKMQSVVDASYRLQQGDVVSISVWGEETMQMKDLRVLPDGTLSFPLVGSIPVLGNTANQVSSMVADKLKVYLPEPQVTVIVTSTEGNRAYILGKVARPGPISLATPITIMQALSLAGALDRFADKSGIKLVRNTEKGQVVIPINYQSLMRGEKLEENILLKTGDTIVIP